MKGPARYVKSPIRYSRLNDEALLTLAREGDEGAYETLVRRYQHEVYTSAFFMMGNAADAHDASQEVFIKLYFSLGKFAGRSSFSTWLYRLTINTCIDELRSRKRYRNRNVELEGESCQALEARIVSEKGNSPEEECLNSEIKEILAREVVRLHDRHRIPFVLRDVYGYSYKEIAEILRLPLGTVKSNIFRARRLLRDMVFKGRGKERNRDEDNILFFS